MSRPTALVTGASAGLGQRMAELLAADGHDLILVARRQDRLDRLASELADAHGCEILVIALDLARPDAPREVVERIRTAERQVDVLVNNAGFGTHGPFAELDLGRELEMIHVNVTALVHLTGLLLRDMVARGMGKVLNVASTAAFQPGPFMATYYATKAFVLSFSEALAYELRGTGVTVTAHCPGATATEFSAVARADRSRLFSMGAADADTVARHALVALKNGTVVAVPGAKNWLGAFATRFSPRSVVRALAAFINGTG